MERRMPSATQHGAIQPLLQLSLTISPEVWLSAPHRQSGTTLWSTRRGGGRKQQQLDQGGAGESRAVPAHRFLRSIPLSQPFGEFLEVPWPSNSNHLLPIVKSHYSTISPPCAPHPLYVPEDFPPFQRQNSSHIRVVTANHLSIGDLVTKAIGGFVGVHRHIQHIRGVNTAKGH